MRNYSTVNHLQNEEITTLYGIPPDEVKAFKDNIRVYKSGNLIIREGEDDQTLYFLRFGEVGVHKQHSGMGSKRIATIEAVNFFGEMSLVTGEKRTATVDVISSEAVVYAMPSADIYKIMQHKRWGELMFERLCNNLADANTELARAQTVISEYEAVLEPEKNKLEAAQYKYSKLKDVVTRIFATLIAVQKAVKGEAVVTSRGWQYLMALDTITTRLLRRYAPEIHSELGDPDPEMIRLGIGSKEIKKTNSLLAELFKEYY